jgi:hypothetical protein
MSSNNNSNNNKSKSISSLLGIHPNIVSAFEAQRWTSLTTVQYEALSRIAPASSTLPSSAHLHYAALLSSSASNAASANAADGSSAEDAGNNNNSNVNSGNSASIVIPPDLIVETVKDGGHYVCMIFYAAQMVLATSGISLPPLPAPSSAKGASSNQQQPQLQHYHTPFAIIVAKDVAGAVRILNISRILNIKGVTFCDVSSLDARHSVGSKFNSVAQTVLVGTVEQLSKLDFAPTKNTHHAVCVTLLVQEAAPDSTNTILPGAIATVHASAASNTALSRRAQQRQNYRGGGTSRFGPSSSNSISDSKVVIYTEIIKKTSELVNTTSALWPDVNICFFTSKPPSSIHASLRYLLRRSHRCYLPARNPIPTFTFLLCLGSNDRADLCLALTQLRGFRRVLILTHNREVKDVRNDLYRQLGLKTFAINRATQTEERGRILADFLQADQAALIAMDAFTGVDLVDVDAIIQYYTPQKSMPDEDWDDFVTLLKTTGESNPEKHPSLVVTLGAMEDLGLVRNIQNKLGINCPLLNLSPNHANFEDFIYQPNLAVLARIADPHEQDAAAGVLGNGASWSHFKKQFKIRCISSTYPSSVPPAKRRNSKNISDSDDSSYSETDDDDDNQNNATNYYHSAGHYHWGLSPCKRVASNNNMHPAALTSKISAGGDYNQQQQTTAPPTSSHQHQSSSHAGDKFNTSKNVPSTTNTIGKHERIAIPPPVSSKQEKQQQSQHAVPPSASSTSSSKQQHHEEPSTTSKKDNNNNNNVTKEKEKEKGEKEREYAIDDVRNPNYHKYQKLLQQQQQQQQAAAIAAAAASTSVPERVYADDDVRNPNYKKNVAAAAATSTSTQSSEKQPPQRVYADDDVRNPNFKKQNSNSENNSPASRFAPDDVRYQKQMQKERSS